ncbi:MAG: ABC transporter ATP-binding protein [Alcanivorax sp.]|jgi:branched-chain amino acid transport system ATP-binding protein|nr:ABC transporter ATP-binding protein [Alcanivorax sp.]MAY10993.1 ABC transporter ATP-binding protein [Alcanivorax sp.]MBI56195.1 ABC transporter ATP-binding protein [Alcanivorax sp.]HCE39065.1 ABC transporter ATP-binding protein [Alcanivorax sp.]|tara:strand:+ start:1389 stop:2108 length:720 start_codon:yes stop_codon:yes gene_type:complete
MKPIQTLLEVNDLNAFYGRAQILFDVSLKVGRGEVVALMGRNGAGKSTTMKTIMGLVERRTGSVSFRKESIERLAPFRICQRGLGFVPEDRRIFTDLSVMENLEVGRLSERLDAPYWDENKLFKLFPNLGEMPNRPGGQMSGGEQQMLTISRTLMGNPYLVLLDEPSEGVAPLIVEQMAEMIVELKKNGLSVLLSEQNIHFAKLVSDRAYILENGQVRYQGSMSELAADEATQQKYLSV